MQITTQSAPETSTERAVEQMRGLQKGGRHAEALAEADAHLGRRPENRDLLLIRAISLRHLGRIPEALATLDRLEALKPRFSLMHQERGLCFVALKDAPRTIEALLRAVGFNPALPMSWRMLEGVWRIAGDTDNAAVAAQHVATLKALPPAVVSATALFFDEDLAPAEAMIRAFLLEHGDEPEAMRLLAKIAMARDVLDDADLLLEAALTLAPNHRALRYDYIQCLLKRHKYALARDETAQLLAVEPANLDYRVAMATAIVGLGEHEQAIGLYKDLLADAPGAHDLHLWLGHALKTVGRVPEAIEAYRAAARARWDFGDAYWSLANLKTYRFLDEEIAAMRAAGADDAIQAEDRVQFCFALGKGLEDRGEIGPAWESYARGNALRRAESRYRPEVIEINTRRQIEVCTTDFFRAREGWGAPDPDPIFVLGLPRSGSTLVEQILASHSRVEGTQELAEVQRTVLELMGRESDPDDPRYPGALTGLGRDDFERLGRAYLADTRAYRVAGRPLFIDKMPNNFRHIGLIHLMLPNAKIIDARREPMACCFSNLKQLFAHGQEFTYSVEDIARYYRTYLELMRHWDAALPGRVLRVQHEDVVADLEGSVRRMLAHCGLDFEPACIDFHKTQRSVRTPSSEQVRQPIFRDGLDQWKQYEPWLEPRKIALGDALDRYES